MISAASTIHDLALQHYSHVEVRCGDCGNVRLIGISKLRSDPARATLASLRPRLKCKRCDRRPSSVLLRPWRREDDPDHERYLGARVAVIDGRPFKMMPRGIDQETWSHRDRKPAPDKGCGWL